MRFREWYTDQSPSEQRAIRNRVASNPWTFDRKIRSLVEWTRELEGNVQGFQSMAAGPVQSLTEEIVYELRQRDSRLP